MDANYIFHVDIHKEIVSNCLFNPTKVLQKDAWWLWARNDKYQEVDSTKIGKWMLFLPKSNVDLVWNQIKNAVKEGYLWHTKVSTTDPCKPKATHAIMIYTKDYMDLEDVIGVLDYLESSGIKPTNTVIRYKTDQQTYANIYSEGGKQKASIYASNTIKSKLNETKGNDYTRRKGSSIKSWCTPVEGSSSAVPSKKKKSL